jgi:hypothetical protein
MHRQDLMSGKVRKELYLRKETLMMKINKQKMHMTFVRGEYGSEDKKNANKEKHN